MNELEIDFVDAGKIPLPFRMAEVERPGCSTRIVGSDYPGQGTIGELNACRLNSEEIATFLLHAANVYPAILGALQTAFNRSCERSEARVKWTQKDQDAHEALGAALKLAKLPGNATATNPAMSVASTAVS